MDSRDLYQESGDLLAAGERLQRALEFRECWKRNLERVLAWFWYLLSVGFWWSHAFSVDLCFLISEAKMGTKMIPNTWWSQKTPGSLPGLQGRGQPIKIQPFPSVPRLGLLWWGWGWGTEHSPLLGTYVLSSVRKDRQWADVAFTFSQVTTEHWGWLVLVRCQNYNKISNLYPLPTYLIIFPESASLCSSRGCKRQRKESSKGAHPLRDTDPTIWSETPCVFQSSMPPLVNTKGWLGVWSP